MPPPSPEHEAAAAAGEEVRRQIHQWADEAESATERRGRCGCGSKALLDRHNGRGRGSVVRLDCGNAACPYCWGRRVADKMNRAAKAVLLAVPGETPYRTEVVHEARLPRRTWENARKAIKRRVKRAGVVRVCTRGGDVLIVAECPFRGSQAVTPSAAALHLGEAIRSELSPRKHAVQILGRWKPPQAEPRWEVVPTKSRPEAIRQMAEKCGARVRDLRTRPGFSWAFPLAVPDEAVQQFLDWLRGSAEGCPSLAQEKACLKKGKLGHEGDDAGPDIISQPAWGRSRRHSPPSDGSDAGHSDDLPELLAA